MEKANSREKMSIKKDKGYRDAHLLFAVSR